MIEVKLGREKTIEKGPRTIDLDILLYRNEQIETERLTIPHPLMLEREFVLRPLCEYVYYEFDGGDIANFREALQRVELCISRKWPEHRLSFAVLVLVHPHFGFFNASHPRRSQCIL